MIRIVGFVVLGVLAYGGFLLATFPAERAFALIADKAPEVRVAGVSGTAWCGQAKVLQIRGTNLERVKWQLKPWSVLTGQLKLDLELDGPNVEGSTGVGLHRDGGVTLNDVNMRLDAAQLSSLLDMPVDLAGQFDVQLESAELMGQALLQSAQGTVRWQRATVTSPVTQTLGEYVAQLSTAEDGIKAQVKDDGGPLQLDGTALLTPKGTYNFNGSVSVRDTQEQLLVQGVRALGRPGKDGRVPLRYSGRL